MYLYGAGGHAKVILDILKDMGQSVLGVFDDKPGAAKLQNVEIWEGLLTAGKRRFHGLDAPLILSVGDNACRAELARTLGVMDYGQAVHGSAVISRDASLGPGTVVLHGAVVQTGARIGAHVVINALACVAHDARVGDFAHVCPHVTLCGHVEIGEGTLVGARAVVIPCVRVGRWCKIGAGAVVVRNVPDFATVVGNPARILGPSTLGRTPDSASPGSAVEDESVVD